MINLKECKTMSETLTNLTRQDYQGAKSTLCTGCGHDSITNNLVSALFQSLVNPYKVAKLSGIGCSSKTPAYFLSKSSGFNSLHGRMAPLSTGVKLSNRELQVLGVSGDGDTASIGMGGLVHLLRRNVPMTYIVENNGVYGLTKGQFSATADLGSKQKTGESNQFVSIDLCALAIELGCTFVARSFSGDAKQLIPLLRAAFQHEGTAFIDIISPCVTFANNEGSTKSYDYIKEHKFNLQELGFISPRDEIQVDYNEGETKVIELHDGSKLTLKKLSTTDLNLTDANQAMQLLRSSREKNEFVTGLLHYRPEVNNLVQTLNITEKPLSSLTEKDLRGTKAAFEKIMEDFV